MKMDYIVEAKRIFQKEIDGLTHMQEHLGQEFSELVELVLNCEGRVILTGVGKSGLICRKISATMSSLGTSAYYLHPTEAVHGDLGFVQSKDLVIAVSNSGETDELLQIIPSVQMIGATIVAVTGKDNTTLAKFALLNIVLAFTEEACYYNLAPTTSTTGTLVFGDALALVVSRANGFDKGDFALYHPRGNLGKKLLLKTSDLMYKDAKLPKVLLNTDFREVVFEMNSKSMKMVNVVDSSGKLLGIITDGDVRRSLYEHELISQIKVKDIYQPNPVTISEDALAIDAMKAMIKDEFTYSFLPVIDEHAYLKGVVTFIDIAKSGISV
ncbi:KpsF/GutQ family sugar-phosphate isomerase [Paenibacillus amylolyticus]|uniref:KpsF/GutQ family protein n=1 Tax=Paenibacillus amylolyticus TaxID=1451 RepID=A0A100VRH4_PAEAM|nr:KpsF/GutQ family sugar-phosphate isomerase [Paenibacillus amylolyticus]GAS84700.1 KpsF/GutQ family protein [Paenibacillus amylolyticus]